MITLLIQSFKIIFKHYFIGIISVPLHHEVTAIAISYFSSMATFQMANFHSLTRSSPAVICLLFFFLLFPPSLPPSKLILIFRPIHISVCNIYAPEVYLSIASANLAFFHPPPSKISFPG